MKKLLFTVCLSLLSCLFYSCRAQKSGDFELYELLAASKSDITTFGIIREISAFLQKENRREELIIFLTSYVEEHPEDEYCAYYLLLTAHLYLQMKAEAVAEYYFERALKAKDLVMEGKSVHLTALKNLIHISADSKSRIKYFNELINRFHSEIAVSEIYYRLAKEYEREKEWEKALKSYKDFLSCSDAASVQIDGDTNAYHKAKQIVNFSRSNKALTSPSLKTLVASIKNAIDNYDWRTLDRYRAQVNFFTVSWKQDADVSYQESFSMRAFMRGNRIQYSASTEEGYSHNEAYLRTSGWSNYVSVWYLYFRRVNYPLNPAVHGNWEWAGIYMGERL